MKLAIIYPEAIASCCLCGWNYKAPTKKVVVKPSSSVKDLTVPERELVLEEQVLAHLHHTHDRLLLTKEEQKTDEGVLLKKVYYFGRRPERR